MIKVSCDEDRGNYSRNSNNPAEEDGLIRVPDTENCGHADGTCEGKDQIALQIAQCGGNASLK